MRPIGPPDRPDVSARAPLPSHRGWWSRAASRSSNWLAAGVSLIVVVTGVSLAQLGRGAAVPLAGSSGAEATLSARSSNASVVSPMDPTPTLRTDAASLEDQDGFRSDVLYTSTAFGLPTSFRMTHLEAYFQETEWCTSRSRTTSRSITLAHAEPCRGSGLMILRPFIVECGTAEDHPDARTLAAAVIAHPRFAAARDLGTLQTSGAVPGELFAEMYTGRAIEFFDASVATTDEAIAAAPCRFVMDRRSANGTLEIRGDLNARLVLLDVRGELVVLFSELSDPEHLLRGIYDLRFE